MSQPRDPRTTPVNATEHFNIPTVWRTVLTLVGGGIVLHIVLAFTVGSGLLIWPFIWAICVMLIVSDAADATGGGISPVLAYTTFLGTLIGVSLFVFLVSKTINPWVLLALVVVAGIYLAKDWKKRWEKEREIQRRRLAGLCLRCCEPVTDGIEDACENCGLPVNPERMNLFRLGKAMRNKSQDNTRKVLTDSKPTRADKKFSNLQQARAASYKRKK